MTSADQNRFDRAAFRLICLNPVEYAERALERYKRRFPAWSRTLQEQRLAFRHAVEQERAEEEWAESRRDEADTMGDE